jgi:hypothetical protein
MMALAEKKDKKQALTMDCVNDFSLPMEGPQFWWQSATFCCLESGEAFHKTSGSFFLYTAYLPLFSF